MLLLFDEFIALGSGRNNATESLFPSCKTCENVWFFLTLGRRIEGFWERQNVHVPVDLHTWWMLRGECVGGGVYTCLGLVHDSKCLHEWHVAGRQKAAATFLKHWQTWREMHIARQTCYHHLCHLYQTPSPLAQNSGKMHRFDSFLKKWTCIPPISFVDILFFSNAKHMEFLHGCIARTVGRCSLLAISLNIPRFGSSCCQVGGWSLSGRWPHFRLASSGVFSLKGHPKAERAWNNNGARTGKSFKYIFIRYQACDVSFMFHEI